MRKAFICPLGTLLLGQTPSSQSYLFNVVYWEIKVIPYTLSGEILRVYQEDRRQTEGQAFEMSISVCRKLEYDIGTVFQSGSHNMPSLPVPILYSSINRDSGLNAFTYSHLWGDCEQQSEDSVS